MIKGNISNIENLSNLPEMIINGLNYIKNTNFSSLKDGKVFIDGENMFVNIQTYMTKEDANYEAHRKYADIQYIISGSEKIGVTDYKTCPTVIAYDEANDIEFLSGTGNDVVLKEGEFLILYPEDAHKPSISINESTQVRKAVVKVLL